MKSDIPERTFEFAVCVVRLYKQLDASRTVPRAIADQLLRSGTSIGANVAEAQGCPSHADFANKYAIACKEAHETQFWLRLLVAADFVPTEQFTEITQECGELVAILTATLRSLREKRN